MMCLNSIKKSLKKHASQKDRQILQKFFKTDKGEYGEGDIFIGVRVPQIRLVAKKYVLANFSVIQNLLNSKIHEERLLALLLLIQKLPRAKDNEKYKIFTLYISNTKNINNWDLVDLSAPQIAGTYLFDKNKRLLYSFAESKLLWERRIAIIATFHFIKNNSFEDCLKISTILLNDKEDLIHKAVGWMLREIGKKDLKTEEHFLKTHYKKMPRTMLRYAIEKFEESKRQKYLKGWVK